MKRRHETCRAARACREDHGRAVQDTYGTEARKKPHDAPSEEVYYRAVRIIRDGELFKGDADGDAGLLRYERQRVSS